MQRSFIDIYNNKSRFKLGFVIIALILGIASLIYTNTLVDKLAQREKRLIHLYEQALEEVIKPDIGDELTFLLHGVITTNTSIPVILASDTTEDATIISYRNIDVPDDASLENTEKILEKEFEQMKIAHTPIVVDFDENEAKNYIYYRDSDILLQLRYYPYVQLLVIFIFGFLTYLSFSYSRRAEQNRIWVGLAKETAHQLGTPISSLMAWVSYIRTDADFNRDDLILELEKDVKRLEMVTARFSNIGSEPIIKKEDIYFIVLGAMNYLQRRISSKIKIEVVNQLARHKMVSLNRHLFEWVIENICKNAADAMPAGKGEIKVFLNQNPEGKIIIDISDTGKGIAKSQISKVFNAGFTTKKRGWGLGLTLAKRIIENYHRGKLFVKQSEINKGTTFRIILSE